MSKQNMEEEMGKIAESLDRMGLDGADNGTRSEQEPVAATLEQQQTVVSEKGPRDNCGNEEKTVRYVNRGPFGRRGAVHSVILKIFVHRDSEIDARRMSEERTADEVDNPLNGSAQTPVETPSKESEVDERTHRTEEINVDLSKDNSLIVDISDALSERDKVKYTVHTRTTLPIFAKGEMSVVREHEEFIWLHSCLEENEAYAGFIIPPAPPRPDFDASREKLQKLGEGESTMTKDEFQKMKQELEQEYLATFKKTVAMHEVFLCRLAAHPVFRNDQNFRIFLEYEQDLSVRGKNRKEYVGSIWKRFTQSADEVLLSGQKDVDDFFEHERNYLVEYHAHIKDATSKSDRVAKLHKNVADSYAKIASCLEKSAAQETERDVQKLLARGADLFEKLKKLEARVGTDEELKLSDTLRYYMKDTQAAKDLLYRRMRCLANYEAANKNLERARGRNKDVPKAEAEQSEACKKFEEISEVAKGELQDLKKRRLAAFKKNLIDLADLEVKHAKAQITLLQQTLTVLQGDSP